MRASALLAAGALLVLGPAGAAAQTAARVPAAAIQIEAAIAPLPDEFREGATVLGYREGTKGLVTLREGKGPYICLADDPAEAERFHTACYHGSLEPFMLRGRELRAAGITGPSVDSARYAEVESGKLKMPAEPAALYSLTGTPEHVDASGKVSGARAIYVVYIPYATSQTTGIPSRPTHTGPWLMFPGTAKAHIMFAHDM